MAPWSTSWAWLATRVWCCTVFRFWILFSSTKAVISREFKLNWWFLTFIFTCVEWIFQYFDNRDIANLLPYFFPRQFLTTLWRTSNAINYNNFYNSKYNVVVESFPCKYNIQEYFCEFYQVKQLDDQHFSKNSIVLKWASILKRPNHLFRHFYFHEELVFHGILHLYWKSLSDSFCEAVDIISWRVRGVWYSGPLWTKVFGSYRILRSKLVTWRVGQTAVQIEKNAELWSHDMRRRENKVDQNIYPLALWAMNTTDNKIDQRGWIHAIQSGWMRVL